MAEAIEPDRTLGYLEGLLWQTHTRSDRDLMEAVFAEDFFEIGRSGRVWQRSEMFGDFGSFDAVLPLPDLRIKLLDAANALITYTSIVKRAATTEYARRSSVWSWQDNRWRLRFHQGTPYRPDEQKAD